jgi:hypothetical protein
LNPASSQQHDEYYNHTQTAQTEGHKEVQRLFDLVKYADRIWCVWSKEVSKPYADQMVFAELAVRKHLL